MTLATTYNKASKIKPNAVNVSPFFDAEVQDHRFARSRRFAKARVGERFAISARVVTREIPHQYAVNPHSDSLVVVRVVIFHAQRSSTQSRAAWRSELFIKPSYRVGIRRLSDNIPLKTPPIAAQLQCAADRCTRPHMRSNWHTLNLASRTASALNGPVIQSNKNHNGDKPSSHNSLPRFVVQPFLHTKHA